MFPFVPAIFKASSPFLAGFFCVSASSAPERALLRCVIVIKGWLE